eukprot:ANDGO_03382.mRNA.1 Crystal protein
MISRSRGPRSRLQCAAFAVVLSLVLCSASTTPVTVSTPLGEVTGFVDSAYPTAAQFLGVPFASPPVGSLRWKSPVEVQPFGRWAADAYKPGCPQRCDLPKFLCPDTVSEDCLYLNVFSPVSSLGGEKGSKNLKPVYVFLPGGAFSQGSAMTGLYGGQIFAEDHDVVSVIVNYRVGATGFIVTESLNHGNYGLEDQRMALLWVQKNIEYFGGDPDRITLSGESAGAMSVALHLTSPLSVGLFHAAVMESNPAAVLYKTIDEAIQYGNLLADKMGCKGADEACLRSKSMDDILNAEQAVFKLPDVFNFSLSYALYYSPVVDGSNVMGQPVDLFEQGKFQKMPILMGTNADEGIMFSFGGFAHHLPDIAYDALIKVIFESKYDLVIKQYPSCKWDWTLEDCRGTLAVLITDYLFVCPSRQMAYKAAANGAPVFFYNFDHVLSFDPWGPNYAYCVNYTCHGSELPFVFNLDGLEGFEYTPAEVVLGDVMNKFWGQYIGSVGDPNAGSKTPFQWPQFDSQTLLQSTFTTAGQGSHISQQYYKSQCDFWDSLGYNF